MSVSKTYALVKKVSLNMPFSGPVIKYYSFSTFSEPETDDDGKPLPVILDDDNAHIGLFLNRRAVYTCINIEGRNLRGTDILSRKN